MDWPEVLRDAVRLCMASPVPTAVWAGADYTLIHNDAYTTVLRELEGAAMGRPAREVWSGVWHALESDFDCVRHTAVVLHREHQPCARQFTWMLAPIRDHDRVLGLFDVCDELGGVLRERAQALAEYAALFESVDIGFGIFELVCDEDGRAIDYRVIAVNPAFAKHGAYPVTLGEKVREQLPDVDHGWWLALLQRVATTGKAAQEDRHASALDRHYHVLVVPHGEPRLRRLAVLFQDVTVRVRAEQALREQAEHQRLLLRLTDALQPMSDLVEIERSAARMLGEYLHASEVLCAEIVDERHAQLVGAYRDGSQLQARHEFAHFDDGMLGALRRGGRVVSNDVAADPRISPGRLAELRERGVAAAMSTNLVRHGRWVASWVVHSSTPRIWTEGEMTLLDEVAERIWSRGEGMKQERMSRFLGVLSHELRNPLAALHNSLQLLERSGAASPAGERAQAIMRRQVGLLGRLVDDLLDLTRIAKGKITLQLERVDLRELARKVVDDMQAHFDERELALCRELGSEPLWVEVDAVRLTQVLSNLLHNAMKFTPAGGRVTLALGVEDGRACLRLRDTGRGMSEDVLERVFEPFEQAEQGHASAHGGLGLGLALVRGLVELHEGRVVARSEGLGRGAEFVVTLPRARVDALGTPSLADRAAVELEREIVVIDDNLDAARALAELLALSGHHVRVAGKGQAGLALVLERAPDVVLCDIGLPDISGYEVAKRVRAQPDLAKTRLIALTGHALPEDLRRAADAGFDAHLAKPIAFDHLEALL